MRARLSLSCHESSGLINQEVGLIQLIQSRLTCIALGSYSSLVLSPSNHTSSFSENTMIAQSTAVGRFILWIHGVSGIIRRIWKFSPGVCPYSCTVYRSLRLRLRGLDYHGLGCCGETDLCHKPSLIVGLGQSRPVRTRGP